MNLHIWQVDRQGSRVALRQAVCRPQRRLSRRQPRRAAAARLDRSFARMQYCSGVLSDTPVGDRGAGCDATTQRHGATASQKQAVARRHRCCSSESMSPRWDVPWTKGSRQPQSCWRSDPWQTSTPISSAKGRLSKQKPTKRHRRPVKPSHPGRRGASGAPRTDCCFAQGAVAKGRDGPGHAQPLVSGALRSRAADHDATGDRLGHPRQPHGGRGRNRRSVATRG
jgi:hypothetical protein